MTKLNFTPDGTVYFDTEGIFSVPDSIESPLMLERFKVVNNTISIVLDFVNMTNEELTSHILNIATVSEYKISLKTKLWNMIHRKVLASKKAVINKPDISDEALYAQLKLYTSKYEDAKGGFDVFEGQALAKGISQADCRSLIISKGNEFLLSEKYINDRIEMVRGLIEDKINAITSEEDAAHILAILSSVDSFSINTTNAEIMTVLS